MASSVWYWCWVPLLAKGKKIRGTFKEEEKYRGESMIMVVSVSVCAESSAGLHAGGGRSALRYLRYVCHVVLVHVIFLWVYVISMYVPNLHLLLFIQVTTS